MLRTAKCIALLAFALTNPLAATELKTTSGQEIGLTLSAYEYQEPPVNVSITSIKAGIDYSATYADQAGWFVRGDARYANGTGHYSGSGHSNGPDWYYEIRGLAGKDFEIAGQSIAAYTGLGYRYLFSDHRGFSSTGAIGYRRESNYYYIPIGVTHKMPLQEGARLTTTVEYDHLLFGRQNTKLSDINGWSDFSNTTNLSNKQKRGFGLKISTAYESESWTIGPYANYWHIQQSKTETFTFTQGGTDYIGFGYEPKNWTLEYGVKASYRF